MSRPPRFQQQCLECLEGIGPRDVDPLDLPDDVDPAAIMMQKFPRKNAGSSFGGKGNSKRREYDAYMRSAAWRGPKGVRRAVLIRDRNRCQDCGDRATTAAHIRYPGNIRDTKPADCKASCKACNDTERQQRITRVVLGD